MIGATRSRSNPKQDEASRECVVYMNPKDDRTRQEFKKESDANNLLQRFGASSLIGLRQPMYLEIDYDLDLQGAKAAVREAKEAFNRLPADLKRKYPTWPHVMNAIQRGEITSEDLKPKAAKQEDTARARTEAEDQQDVRRGAASGSNNDSARPAERGELDGRTGDHRRSNQRRSTPAPEGE